ncbi:MAG: CHAT domain-containing protein [Acidobacteriota bacterium]|nr:CHAT domain-containing protein [Acidobacteriota bacterium]
MNQSITSVPSLAETIFAHGKQLRPFNVEPKELQRALVTKHPEIFLEYAGSLVEEAMDVFSSVYTGGTLDFEDLDNIRARLMCAERILMHLGKDDGLNAAINMIGNIALEQAKRGVSAMTYFHYLALDSFQFIKKYIKPEGEAYGMNLFNEGTALMMLAKLKAERLDEYLEDAIRCFNECRQYFPPHSLEYLNALKHEAESLIHLYKLNPQEPELLREAEKVLKEALGLVTKDSVEQAEFLVLRATLPIYEFVLRGNQDADVIRVSLDRAVSYCVDADKIYEEKIPQSAPRGICLMHLGEIQRLLANLGTDMLANYQLSLTNLGNARQHLHPESIEFCQCLTNEAKARTDIATREKVSLLSNLVIALDLLREAQKTLYKLDRESADYADSLYAEAYVRYMLGTNKHGARENLQRCIELCGQVQEMVGFGTALFIDSLLTDSKARLELAEITGRSENLDAIYYMLGQAQELLTPGSSDYADCLLAKAQLLRIARRPLAEVLEVINLARDNYERAGDILRVLSVESQSALAEVQAGEFASARLRCVNALGGQADLLKFCYSMRDKKFLLEQNALVRTTLVEACLAEEMFEDAVCHLERGRNQLLGEYFQTLSEHFQQILGEIEEPDIRQMQRLAQQTNRTIVNLSICTDETVAFIFRPNQTLRVKKLPIKQQELFDQIFERDLAGRPQGWFSSYFDYIQNKQQKRDYLPDWRNQISRTLDWLIAYFVRPLYEELGEDENRLAIVAGNKLSMLPLHAAIWLYKSAEDEYAELPDIVFASSMWLLQQSIPTAVRAQAADENSVAVFRWQGDDLRWAQLEIEQIQKTMADAPPPLIFSGEEHSFDESLNLASSHSIWHFACHGLWEWGDILSSTLLLTNENSLSLDSLFENYAHRFASVRLERDTGILPDFDEPVDEQLYNPQLVVFSACEIGIGTEAFTETESCFSFPTAFLLAGTRCVIAALWAVDDFTTSVLMGRFYENLGGGQSYSIALRDAQVWMKNLKLEQLRELVEQYEHLPDYPKIVKRLNRWRRKKVEHPFADPYYWAAFQVTGNSSAGR